MYDREMSEGANAALESEARANQALAEEAGLSYQEAEAAVERAQRRSFDPSKHMRQLRGRGGVSEYLDVKYRIEWFRAECAQGQIKTWLAELDHQHPNGPNQAVGFAMFKCRVRDGAGGEAWGWGTETAGDFGDYIEKAETKAIGRALGALGYGTAGVHEMTQPGHDEPRVVDSPVRQADHGNGQRPERAPQRADEGATAAQLKFLNRLIDELGLDEAAFDDVLAEAGTRRKEAYGKRELGEVINLLVERKKRKAEHGG